MANSRREPLKQLSACLQCSWCASTPLSNAPRRPVLSPAFSSISRQPTSNGAITRPATCRTHRYTWYLCVSIATRDTGLLLPSSPSGAWYSLRVCEVRLRTPLRWGCGSPSGHATASRPPCGETAIASLAADGGCGGRSGPTVRATKCFIGAPEMTWDGLLLALPGPPDTPTLPTAQHCMVAFHCPLVHLARLEHRCPSTDDGSCGTAPSAGRQWGSNPGLHRMGNTSSPGIDRTAGCAGLTTS
mmetsp:Transcript_42901/g.107206  ORF Transcript_42901/g.107206 Transcript_42901/m.107206 type:complete len:244 (+) Transcript_42901:3132-3863(+)